MLFSKSDLNSLLEWFIIKNNGIGLIELIKKAYLEIFPKKI
jgi:hypothetical protein